MKSWERRAAIDQAAGDLARVNEYESGNVLATTLAIERLRRVKAQITEIEASLEHRLTMIERIPA